MADLKFKQNGLRVLDSRAGDLLIADPRLDVQIMFTAEYLKLATEDPQKMAALGRRLVEFITRHTERRWKRVEEDLKAAPTIRERNKMKLKTRTIDDLRKIEKEIYFYKNSKE